MIRALHVRATDRQAVDLPRRWLPYVALLPLCSPLWLGCGDDSTTDPGYDETDTEATGTGDPAGLMMVTPMMLSLAVGASADVVVTGNTTAFPLGPDEMRSQSGTPTWRHQPRSLGFAGGTRSRVERRSR